MIYKLGGYSNELDSVFSFSTLMNGVRLLELY